MAGGTDPGGVRQVLDEEQGAFWQRSEPFPQERGHEFPGADRSGGPAERLGSQAFFDSWRVRIDELVDGHADMRVVEHAIDAACGLDAEERDALWLWTSARRKRLM